MNVLVRVHVLQLEQNKVHVRVQVFQLEQNNVHVRVQVFPLEQNNVNVRVKVFQLKIRSTPVLKIPVELAGVATGKPPDEDSVTALSSVGIAMAMMDTPPCPTTGFTNRLYRVNVNV